MSYAIYRRLFSRALGEGAYSSLKGINMTDADFRGLQKELGLKAGQRFYDIDRGKSYRIVRARSTFAEGNTLKLYFGAAGRNPTFTAATTKAIATTNKTFVAHDLAGGEVFIYGGTDAYESRYIIDNDDAAGASTITVAEDDSSQANPAARLAINTPDAFTTLPDGTSTAQVVVGWEYVQTTAAVDNTKGIALGAVTSGNWTVVQEGGFGLVLLDGTTDVVLGDYIGPSATAGTAQQSPATVAGALSTFGQALAAYTTNSANLILCDIWCSRFGIGASF